MTLFSNKLEIEIKGQGSDTNGRFLLLKYTIQGTKIILYNVYAPNNYKEHADFLYDIKNVMSGHRRI